MRRRLAFTLVELLVVVAIIAILVAMITPAIQRTVYLTRSATCGSNKHQIAVGMYAYAKENRTYYPARWPTANTYNHAYWFGKPNNALDLHEEFEKFLGTAMDDGPPPVLVCTVEPTGIWGRKIPWPMSGIYRTNVSVYAGYDWRTASASACLPQQDLDQMPQKIGDVPHRPLAGDLIEYMSDNSSQGFSGWDTAHAYRIAYHVRHAGGPEELPDDPIPFAYGDGSVRFTSDLEPCYTDPGWGTNYWPDRWQ